MIQEEISKEIRKVEIVTASGAYPVWIGRELLAQAGERIKLLKSPCRVAIISDYTTGGLFENKVERSLKRAGFQVTKLSLPPGEGTKNMTRLAEVLEFLAESGLDRSDLVVALGGGVVGDLAGFAAAVYLRGVDYVQLPTTFLAAIDSSVGGKTAVDLGAGKNLAGAFHQPIGVLCDCDTFQTLPDPVFADGVAEAVKYGVLAGGDLFSLLEQGEAGEGGKRIGLPAERISQVVEQCVRIKAEVVGRDEFDRGERQLLNLGHTAGHAIEHCSGFSITHGRAVAMGLALVARAAEAAGVAEQSCADRICKTLAMQGLPTQTELSTEELFEASLSDKKKQGQTMQIIVPIAIGRCEIRRLTQAQWRQWICMGTGRGGPVK